MCHGNHGNYFSNYYPPTSTVYVDPNEDTATDDAPFDLTDGVAGISTPDYNGSSYYHLSSVVISAVSGNAGDQLTLDLSDTAMVLTDGTVSFNGVDIATVTGGTDGTPLTITAIGNSGSANTYVQFMALIDSVHYANTTEDAPFSRVVNIFVDFADTTDRSFDVTVNVQNGASIPELNLFSADHETLTAQGSDATANTFTTSTQYQPSTTTMADGTTVVIWSSYNQDGSGYGIYGQRFDASGAKIGDEFRVNTATTNDQYQGKVMALDDGGFVVAWQSSQTGSYGVYFQRYDADGAPVGSETFVGATQSVDMLSFIDLEGDGFAIGWMAPGSTGGYSLSVQRYTGEGVADGAPTVVYDGTTYISEAVFSPLGDGFVAVYRGLDTASGQYSIFVAPFDADGAPIGSPAIVSASTSNGQMPVVTELDDGRFVVAWSDYSSAMGDYNIFAQVFNTDGTAAGDVVQVNAVTAGYQYYPSVVALSDGGFAVSWGANTGRQYDVYVRSFDGDGQPTSGDVLVNSTTVGNQFTESGQGLTQLPDGSLLVAFRGPGVSGEDVFTRILAREDLAVDNTPPSADVEIPLVLTWGDSKDGSETMQVVLSGFPEGATFNMGAAGDGGTWVIDVTDPADLANLVMTPPQGYSGDFEISVVATSTETSNGDTASDTLTFGVHVEYTNSAPELDGTPATLADGTEDQDYVVSAADLLAGYSDFDDDTLSVDNLTADHGTVTDNGDGTYTITPEADYNGPVELSYDVVDGNGGTISGSQTFDLAPANDPPTGAVTISGTIEEDSTLTASNSLSDPEGVGTVSYQWQRDGADIDGATGDSYTLTQDDVGHSITVVATYTDGDGNAAQATSDATAAVANVNDSPTGAVTISGTVTQGEVLTASNTLADEDGVGTVTYQWQRDGADIDGATGGQYTLTQDDVGHAITVVASYTDGQGTAEEVTSDATSAVANVNDPPAGSVTISGTAEEDSVLTASNTLSDPDGNGTVTYQWQRDGADIDGATGGTYTLTQDDVGHAISVLASYTDGAGNAEQASSDATAAVANLNDSPSGSVTISGTAAEDQVLTASNTLDDEDGMGTVSYQWQRDGADIDGATGGTYTLTQDDVGHAITVVAIYTDGEGTVEEVASDPTAAVTNVADAPAADPAPESASGNEDTVITGTLLHGSDEDGDTLTYGVDTTTNGSVVIDPNTGAFSFTPDANFNGTGGFTYVVNDGTSDSAPKSVTIDVAAVNDDPTVSGSIASTADEGDAAYSVDLLAGASDVEGDSLTVTGLTLVDGDASGITVNGNSLTVDPGAYAALSAGESEVISYTYTIDDGNGGTVTQTATITIDGTTSSDTQVGTRRADILTGDRNASGTEDVIRGEGGNDLIDGKDGDDQLEGGGGGDRIWGGSGNDRISGDAGIDLLWGGDGDDRIDGGASNDRLYGEDGNDFILGGVGSDVMAGGAGSDTFAFEPGRTRDRDVITDFTIGEDFISLGTDVTILSQSEARDGSTVLKLSTGASVTLLGVSLSDWTAAAGDSVIPHNSGDLF